MSSSSQFFLQYVSVILIIVTFTIGSLSRPKGDVHLSVNEKVNAPFVPADDDRLSSKLEYHDLFLGDSLTPWSDKMMALASLLHNHDLLARFEVVGYGSLEANIERSVAIHEFLEAQGVDPRYFEAIATSPRKSEDTLPATVLVTWRRMAL